MSPESRARLVAFGDELLAIHRGLRAELARLRTETDDYLAGGPRPRDLKAHCLAFCTALTSHHTGEDRGAFPALAARDPELRPLIAKMEEDHAMMSGLLQSLERVLDTLPEDPGEGDAARVRGELEGLSAIVESHFRFEERTIVAALNALPAGAGSTEDLLGLPGPGKDGA
ncbi:hemerythrin domain-containing protein [Streptomyces sp. NBC_01808]|uniref:hemerythrin domain-containing protein n=1 Tax=Streptomyces sp. NBC_01808 TaxID=2975947 RepID=UPI002DDC1595|nr:hemerythrin domain-containing protein [Streptomyces sp. NBC_01808]WSA40656.1 hemerythrin domain-containing protein [Streptomyces sp. NBC_01808]